MGVAEDADLGVVVRGHLGRRRPTEFMAMLYMDRDAADGEIERLMQSPVSRPIAVTEDRLHRAISASSSRISSPQTSPACRIRSTPVKAVWTSARSRPCVSAISPIRITEGAERSRPPLPPSHSLSAEIVGAPARGEGIGHAEMVERACDDEVDHLRDGRRPVIEPRRGRMTVAQRG